MNMPKFLVFALVAIGLAGCLMELEKAPDKVVMRDHEVPAACLQMEDSVTFSDSGEGWHYSCTIGDTARGSK